MAHLMNDVANELSRSPADLSAHTISVSVNIGITGYWTLISDKFLVYGFFGLNKTYKYPKNGHLITKFIYVIPILLLRSDSRGFLDC